MKTPEELVRDLRTIARYLKCSQCFVECSPKEECVFTAAAKLIEELETLQLENAAKQQAIEAAAKLLELRTRERDAAVEQLRGKCFACAKAKRAEIGTKNLYTCEEMKIGGYRSACPEWEWRGVQEVAEDDEP